MNKKLVIIITFLSIFLLIGASYQPIIAEEPILEKISKTKDFTQSISKIDDIKELYNRISEDERFKKIIESYENKIKIDNIYDLKELQKDILNINLKYQKDCDCENSGPILEYICMLILVSLLGLGWLFDGIYDYFPEVIKRMIDMVLLSIGITLIVLFDLLGCKWPNP